MTPYPSRYAVAVALLLVSVSSFWVSSSRAATAAESEVPGWAQHAIWYQVFVERFRNGDPANDPVLSDLDGAWPAIQPDGWRPTPWGHDWYALDEWERPLGDFYQSVYLRRYGGDLQGLISKLDYLQQLGITALYLNPINDSPSLHKYDARHYRHVDRNFGPDPLGDAAILQQEDPLDADTWRWTAADKLLLKLIDEVHRRGMRIILDYSWNHTGSTFWAWQDVVQNQRESRMRNWYQVESFDDPLTETNEFSYRGWHGVKELPEFRRVIRADGRADLHNDVKRHIRAVTRRWLDPNQDGDPSDGIDGFRLDVAAELPDAFFQDYRRYVKQINPEAVLIGEIWWDKWPVRLADPSRWLQGDMFDATMNYRWYVAARGVLANGIPTQTPTTFHQTIQQQHAAVPVSSQRALMTMLSGHDSPRSVTSLLNKGLYKYQSSPRGDPRYKVYRPGGRAYETLKLMLLSQFTSVGAPHVYYGDEVGMWGADDPDNRKPMLWSDIDYEDEDAGPFHGRRKEGNEVRVNLEILGHYRKLTALRRRHATLFVTGRYRADEHAASDDWLVWVRSDEQRRAHVVINLREQQRSYELRTENGVSDPLSGEDWTPGAEPSVRVDIPARSGRVLIERQGSRSLPPARTPTP